MGAQEVKGEDFVVRRDSDSSTVKFQGKLALNGPKGYAPIHDLLSETVTDNPQEMVIDLKELAFLNSSGISMLSKFVIGHRKNTDTQLIVLGSSEMPWQNKSLKNLQKFLPSLKLEIE